MERDPGIGLSQGAKDEERFLETDAGFGEFLRVERDPPQFVQAPRLTVRRTHLLERFAAFLKFDLRLGAFATT